MSEYYKDPLLPYDTLSLSEWCRVNGIDTNQFQSWRFANLSIAKLRSREISLEMQLRQEIETSLPLEGSERVEDIGLKPEFYGTQPKIFLAPKGMAYKLEVRTDYDEFDYIEDGSQLPPTKSETATFIGEYLSITTETVGGQAESNITVRERPEYFAEPVFNNGDPREEGGAIRLPSRFNPEEDGAYVSFPRFEGWQLLVSRTDELSGPYKKSKVTLVPFDREQDTELFVADFGEYNDFALDDFIFVDERRIKLPPGFSYFHRRLNNWVLEYHPTNTLILPPIPSDDWTPLWEKHGIMIKFNPTVHSFKFGDSRFQYLDFGDRRSSLEFRIRQFNSYAKNDKFIMRALAIRDELGRTSLKEILKVALSKEVLSEEDERFGG